MEKPQSEELNEKLQIQGLSVSGGWGGARIAEEHPEAQRRY